MFSEGQIIFAICFIIGFSILLAIAYKKDYKLHQQYYKGSIWVEDKYINANVGHELGFDALIMEHGHNMYYEGPCKLVKNWEEIYNYVNR